ncbi:MAG TPA: VWA domain-containing protein [Candidatus Sulfotelmatobacter sp.]|nr:VWA domain-containing protein [Candidatus Sulfotelmatobacter sp.]
MSFGRSFCAPLLAFVSCVAAGQVLTFPGNTASKYQNAVELDAIQTGQMEFNLFTINGQNSGTTPLQTPSGSVSMLDLKAPAKAQKEYTKGYQLLMHKDVQGAIEHLEKAIAIYPKYVAAHNALGSAYLNLNQHEKARAEFAKAIELDDHMPNSYLNLGCAQLGLKQYSAAEENFRKASSIAPLDMQVQLGLAYAEYANKDYPALLDTVHDVHAHPHQGAALVHFFAAAGLVAQNNLAEAENQMRLVLKEDPKSPSADLFRKSLEDLKAEERWREQAHFNPLDKISYSIGVPTGPSPEAAGRMAQLAFQDMAEKEQIEEADGAPDPVCRECAVVTPEASNSESERVARKFSDTVFRSTVDEVSILFAATDHGRSVTNLSSSDVVLRDNSRSPSAILNFRNESQLPLRLGLVIDTSNSVMDRFKFEKGAAGKFLDKVLTGPDDLAFVVGVNNSVLLVQDFTPDHALTTHAIDQLAPAGGTALWDAVSFATDKLARHPETQPVARILVVISDGEDNSSKITLKQAIGAALRSEVAVYTVSTREDTDEQESALLGEKALRMVSDLTGGADFRPGSVSHLTGSLSQLQEVIRSRYLISYKPALFQRDGHYRPIDISAQKDGHKLRVYARRGYYASAAQPAVAVTQSGVSQ